MALSAMMLLVHCLMGDCFVQCFDKDNIENKTNRVLFNDANFADDICIDWSGISAHPDCERAGGAVLAK